MKKMNFKLFSCCLPVSGFKQQIICDLQRGAIHYIPEGLYEILTIHQNKTIEDIKLIYENNFNNEIEEYFDFLLENDYIFFTDEPNSFPDLNMDIETPKFITDAIIEIGKGFYNDDKLLSIVNQLNKLCCKFIEIRIVENITKLGFNFSDFLTNISEGTCRGLYLYIRHDSSWEREHYLDLMAKNNVISNISVSNFTENISFLDGSVNFTTEDIDFSKSCGLINPKFFTVSNRFYAEAQKYNSCLYKKISLDKYGNIKNCLSFEKAYGNILEDSIKTIISKPEFVELWELKKDDIHTCKVCEFRYICSDCRAFLENPEDIYSKPLKCGYNPYTCEWEEWSTNPLKQKAIDYYGMREMVKKTEQYS